MKAYFSPTMTRNSYREVNRCEIIQLGVAQDRILKMRRSDTPKRRITQGRIPSQEEAAISRYSGQAEGNRTIELSNIRLTNTLRIRTLKSPNQLNS